MEVDGYVIEQDEEYFPGEQFFVTKDGVRVGFIRMDCGIMRVAASHPPESFLLYERTDENTFDEFTSCRNRRAAMRKAIMVLEDYYKDSPMSLASIAKVFPDFQVEANYGQGILPF